MTNMRIFSLVLMSLSLGVIRGDDCGNSVDGRISATGKFCCPSTCEMCGGDGCSGDDGDEGESCCTGAISDAGIQCSDASRPPCMIDNPDGPDNSTPSQTTLNSEPTSNPSPTPIMTISTSCTEDLPNIRWAKDSGVNGRLYAEGEGCVTMTDLFDFRNDEGKTGPVYILNENDEIDYDATAPTGKWLLTSELYITGGATFYCRGKGATDGDGDCDELRIQSRGEDDYHEIRGHGGNLYFENTIVTSWDTDNDKPQEEYEGGRSFLNCLSEKAGECTKEGGDMGECRMDIINSEMGYMGYDASESYGLTWKVRGFCNDSSNPEVFEEVNVYGDIKGSNIHHMYYGMYSFGHQGGVWTDNEMHHNHVYGFDPHDDSDYLTIARNDVHDNFNHGIIASKRCNNVHIYDNNVHDGGEDGAGIYLHRSSDNCKVYGNTISNMQNSGISVAESFDSEFYNNTVNNARYGIRFSTGSKRHNVYENTFKDIHKAAFYAYRGADDTLVDGNYGRAGAIEFTKNEIFLTEVGVKLEESDDIVIEGNSFSDDTTEFTFDDVQDTVWSNNDFGPDACFKDQNDENESTFDVEEDLPPLC